MFEVGSGTPDPIAELGATEEIVVSLCGQCAQILTQQTEQFHTPGQHRGVGCVIRARPAPILLHDFLQTQQALLRGQAVSKGR